MANNKNMPMQPRFNFMWFWALVIVVIIGFSLFGESEPRPIDGDWNMVDELVEKLSAAGFEYNAQLNKFW